MTLFEILGITCMPICDYRRSILEKRIKLISKRHPNTYRSGSEYWHNIHLLPKSYLGSHKGWDSLISYLLIEAKVKLNEESLNCFPSTFYVDKETRRIFVDN